MKRFSVLLLLASLSRAATNDPCTIGSAAGVCIASATCSSGGGTSYTGYCPNDPSDIKCCTKTSCGTGGNCRFNSACTTGNVASGLCPGPSDFKCCLPATASCTPPAVNAATVSLIKSFEGFVASSEADPIGLPTVGYGHLCQTTGCAEVPYSFPMTENQAAALLQSDLKTYTKCISDYVVDTVKLNANQYGALASWTFNVGCGNAKTSSLVSRLNTGDTPNTVAAEELPKWNKAGGAVLAGLTRRRAAEVTLFKTSSSVAAHPPC